jgi:Protein of unknown function (DUF1616)
MYRNRNLDIALAAIIAILGGLAAAKHLPGQIRIPLGIGLFFAPGYLWSEAILSQRLPGIERALTTAGMSLILPILGGFLFYGFRIPLFESAWIALLVVLTLLGVVAAAITRLRQVPADQRQQPRSQQPRQSGSVLMHSFIFGIAAVIGLGSVAYSVKSAETQKFPGFTQLWFIQSEPGMQSYLAPSAALAANPASDAFLATKANLQVTNHEGVPEQYELKLLKNGKVTDTWPITLNDGQTWQKTIAFTENYSMLADLYMLPDTSTPLDYDTNGVCLNNLKVLPAVLRPEDPCDGKS